MRYDIKRDGVTLIEHEIKGKRIKSAPAVDYIEVEFDYFEPVLLKKNDTIEFKGQIYYCDKQSVNIFKKSTNLYNHRARFLGENYKATEIALLDPNGVHNFDIEGNLLTLVTLAVSNLNRVDSGWSFDEDLPATITKKFDIKEENVMSFLAKVSGEFEIPFRIENKVITFAYYEHPDGGEFEYGKGKGFLDLKKSYRNGEKAPNTIFATGGNGFQLNDPIQDDDDVDENGVIEGFYTNERIYPTTRANVLSSVQSNVFRTDLDFSIYNNSIPGQRPLINFETGALAGLSFFLQNEQYDLEGFKILTITKRFVDGVEYPNLLARPLGGDRYNITNIHMPQDAIDDATQRLTIATQNYLRNILDRNLVLDANLDPLYQEDLKLNNRIKIVDVDLDINGYFIINEIKEDLQNLNRKEITLDYVGKNLLNLSLPVVNDNIIEVEIEEINTEIQDIIGETGRLKVEIGNKVDFDNVVVDLSDTNPLNIPNVTAVNEGLYQTLSTANEYTDTAIEGAVYNVTYESETHEITFYRHQQPNIVIDLPIEQLITGVELVGNDLVFTFEDGSVVTVPMNTLLVGVVKKVNGLTPNSQGEVVINIADIPGLSTELSKIGALTTLTTTDKSNLVNAINEVNGNIPNVTGFIPYTDANQPIDFNTQSFRIGGDFDKSFSNFERSHLDISETSPLHFTRLTDVASFSRGNDSTTQTDCIVITLPITNFTRWVMEVDILGMSDSSVFGGASTKLLISAYNTNNIYRGVTAISNADNVKSVSFCRDGNNNTVIIIRPQDGFPTNFPYGKVNISNFYHYVTYTTSLSVKSNYKVEAVLESSLTDLTTNGTITNAQFTRDSYLWNKGDFTQTNVNNWNTAYDWGDFRDYGLARQYIGDWAQQTSFSNIDSTYVTRQYGVSGSFFGIVNSNRPQGWLIKGATADRWSWMGVTDLGPVRIYATNYTAVDNYVELFHTGNFDPSQYVLQTSLNTILGDYATEDWVNSQGFSTQTLTAGTGISILDNVITNTAPNATHTGDVTGTTYLTIANNAVTNPKMAQMNANSIKGRAGSIGNPQDLTPAQVRTMLNVQEGANRTRIGINGGNYTEVGDINLIAGSNISMSKSGENITINSTSQPIDTTVKVYMPGEVVSNDTVPCNSSKTIIYLSTTFTGALNIYIDPDLQDGAELIVIHTSNDVTSLSFNINGSLINLEGQLSSSILASSKEKTYRFIHVKDIERFALVDIGRV